MEDLIEEEDNIITLTHLGYVKRLSVDTYRSQKRGGKGISGLSTREEDFVETLFVTSTHSFILFFTTKGKVFRLKAYQIPEASRHAKGTAIVNLLELEGDEKISAVIPVIENAEETYLMMCTRNGIVKKTALSKYDNIRKGGIAAIVLRDDDELIDVKQTDGTKDVFIGTYNGISIRFKETDARPIGRVSQGVRGIELRKGDRVIGMEIVEPDTKLLVVTENGFGKRTEISEYRVQTRGGKGLLTYRVTDKTGNVAGMKLVTDTDDLMLISIDGTIIRMHVDEISVLGRATQGVTLMRVRGEDNMVVSIENIPREEDEDLEDIEGMDEAEIVDVVDFEDIDVNADDKEIIDEGEI
jgi:DNA gyrase subunit A